LFEVTVDQTSKQLSNTSFVQNNKNRPALSPKFLFLFLLSSLSVSWQKKICHNFAKNARSEPLKMLSLTLMLEDRKYQKEKKKKTVFEKILKRA